jgi:hypothetical protein
MRALSGSTWPRKKAHERWRTLSNRPSTFARTWSGFAACGRSGKRKMREIRRLLQKPKRSAKLGSRIRRKSMPCSERGEGYVPVRIAPQAKSGNGQTITFVLPIDTLRQMCRLKTTIAQPVPGFFRAKKSWSLVEHPSNMRLRRPASGQPSCHSQTAQGEASSGGSRRRAMPGTIPQ